MFRARKTFHAASESGEQAGAQPGAGSAEPRATSGAAEPNTAEPNAAEPNAAAPDPAAPTAAASDTAAQDSPAREPERPRKKLHGAQATPLRFLIVVLIVCISGTGLLGTSVAVSSIMRDVVYQNVDRDLENSLGGWARSSEIFRADAEGARPPSDFVVIKIFQDGSAVVFNDASGRPDLSQVIRDGGIQTVGSDPAVQPQVRWRTITETTDGVTTVVAKSLNPEDTIIARLSGVQLMINVVALAIMGILGYYLTYRALRPLREVERTAGAIAAGDHDRRIPAWPLNTEVGQLAHALNVMLERLQESIDAAREKEDQMRRFVGDASHELRTPLTSVRGYSELYRSGAVKDPEKVLHKIDEESKRMSLLVEDLLALTRAEGQQLDMRPVDLLELCLSVASSARAAFPGRTIRVRNEIADVPMVFGDQSRLHQCLLNLVTNGLRHGGEEAEVTLKLTDDNPGRLRVQVIDDGRGMSPKDAAHIFERFYRADTSRSRASGGSGLGLAITKSLVEKHGGTITVDSEEGKGSTFTISLARNEKSGAAPA